MMTTRALAALVVALWLGASVQGAEPWMRFRGPNGLGVSDATNVPTEFGPDKNVRFLSLTSQSAILR